jgi:hypothetical protein
MLRFLILGRPIGASANDQQGITLRSFRSSRFSETAPLLNRDQRLTRGRQTVYRFW